jgi:hypothetical protein
LYERHEVARQVPCEQRREQQSLEREHRCPVPSQDAETQMPPRQARPVQQPPTSHDAPMVPQPSTQRLRLQRPLQHWPVDVQEFPVATQRVWRQTPIRQLAEQH